MNCPDINLFQMLQQNSNQKYQNKNELPNKRWSYKSSFCSNIHLQSCDFPPQYFFYATRCPQSNGEHYSTHFLWAQFVLNPPTACDWIINREAAPVISSSVLSLCSLLLSVCCFSAHNLIDSLCCFFFLHSSPAVQELHGDDTRFYIQLCTLLVFASNTSSVKYQLASMERR